MKAFVIDGKAQTVEPAEVGREDDMHTLIGQDSIIHDDIDDANAVFFDEDCFIRGTQGRFKSGLNTHFFNNGREHVRPGAGIEHFQNGA